MSKVVSLRQTMIVVMVNVHMRQRSGVGREEVGSGMKTGNMSSI